MPGSLIAVLGVFGLVFGLLASIIAFGITWHEWQKHKFSGTKLWNESLFAGAFAFVFFALLSLVLALVLPSIVK